MQIQTHGIVINVSNTEIKKNIWEYLQHEKKRKELGGSFRRPWTEEDDLKLMEAYEKQIPYEILAVDMKRTINAVRSRTFVLGLTKRPEKGTTEPLEADIEL